MMTEMDRDSKEPEKVVTQSDSNETIGSALVPDLTQKAASEATCRENPRKKLNLGIRGLE